MGVTDLDDVCVCVAEREGVCDLVVEREAVCDIVCVGLVDFKIQTVLDDIVHAAVCISFARHTEQAEQVAAFVTILYVDPATQATHPVFAVVVQVVERRVPAAQTVHAVHIAAFVVVLKVDPATQAVHTLFVVTVQAVDA